MTDNNELAEALAEIAVLRRRWSDSESKLAACDSDLRTILAERDALRVDAERYRFLKVWARQIEVVGTGNCRFGVSTPTWTGPWLDFDAAIDAQRAPADDAALAAEGWA